VSSIANSFQTCLLTLVSLSRLGAIRLFCLQYLIFGRETIGSNPDVTIGEFYCQQLSRLITYPCILSHLGAIRGFLFAGFDFWL
jgi:hypothetical protein